MQLVCFSLSHADETTWEESVAQQFSSEFRNNKNKLEKIATTLDQLPIPYKGEPTASGGFLSHWSKVNTKPVKITFKWLKPHKINAISLCPLRLYLGERNALTENAYWPLEIKINAPIGPDKSMVTIASIENSQLTIRQSLPEHLEFDSISTDTIEIVCTKLTKETTTELYGAGLAEVFIFSNQANIAPRARISTSFCREDKVVFSAKYLADNQTPLGLPEIGPVTPTGLGVYHPFKNEEMPNAHICNIRFEKNTYVDAVRLDPAIIHRPGQSFPVKFIIQLLDKNNKVLHASDDYLFKSFNNPGLNPYIVYFPKTKTRNIRLSIVEAAKHMNNNNAVIQLSEITPILNGIPILKPASFKGSTHTPDRYSQKYDSTNTRLSWTLDSLYDGMTQTGKILSHYEWITGLAQRQKLLEQRASLGIRQVQITNQTRLITIWLTSILTGGIITLATFITLRNRTRTKNQIKHIRESIASDLHDDTGSSLAAITLHASKLRSQSNAPDELTSLNAILRLSKESTFGLREVLHTITPKVGREQDILTYMRELATLTLITKKYTFHSSDFSKAPGLLGPQTRRDLILFYKEALINIQKSSDCNEVKVEISNDNDSFTLKIEDDGKGMTPEQLARPRALRTLKLRSVKLNGELTICNQQRKGLCLILNAPLKERK